VSPELRCVFDTCVVISALLFEHSVPGLAFFAARRAGIILLSQETIAELSEVLGRTKFDRYLTREEREQFILLLLREGTAIEIAEVIHACRDPKDNKFLELAVSGLASCVVSGDEDLLTMHPFRGIPILTPAQFLEWLSERKAEGQGC
jgi:putative PIN family toxin of toxin-antitoxin system